ncbi:MAG: integrase core domain-containing protein [Dehalococcoidia bacterium]
MQRFSLLLNPLSAGPREFQRSGPGLSCLGDWDWLMSESRAGIGAYFGFYNRERPHQVLGYRTPG